MAEVVRIKDAWFVFDGLSVQLISDLVWWLQAAELGSSFSIVGVP